jgi:hypothetical protein
MVQKTKTRHKEKDGGSGADGSTSVLARLKTRRSRWIVRNDDAAGLRPAYARLTPMVPRPRMQLDAKHTFRFVPEKQKSLKNSRTM